MTVAARTCSVADDHGGDIHEMGRYVGAQVGGRRDSTRATSQAWKGLSANVFEQVLGEIFGAYLENSESHAPHDGVNEICKEKQRGVGSGWRDWGRVHVVMRVEEGVDGADGLKRGHGEGGGEEMRLLLAWLGRDIVSEYE